MLQNKLFMVSAVVLMSALLNNTAMAKKAPKVNICHLDKELGEFVLINVSEKAVEKHLANHGDFLPEGDTCDQSSTELGSDLLVGQNLYWSNSNNVALLLNSGIGDATFTSSSVSTWSGIGPIRVADFNGDGNDDFVASHSSFGANLIGIGDGAGGFIVSDTNIKADPAQGASQIEIADVNGDENLDMVMAVSGWYRGLLVALGDGTGAFSEAVYLNTWGGTRSADTGDIDGDGKVDIAISSAQGSHSAQVFWGDGSGANFDMTYIEANTGNVGTAVVDVDGDGDLDVVTGGLGGNSSGTLRVHLNPGDKSRTFTTNQYGAVQGSLHFLMDVDGDGAPDAVTTGVVGAGAYEVVIYLNDGNGAFDTSSPQRYPLPNSYVLCGGCDATQGDFNEDGVADLAFANGSSGTVSILLGDGNGSFQAPQVVSGLTRTVSIAAGNFD